MDEALNDLGEYIASKSGDVVTFWNISLDELALETTRDNLGALMKLVRDDSNCLFKILIDITAVDFPERGERRPESQEARLRPRR